MTRPEIEPKSPETLANTLPTGSTGSLFVCDRLKKYMSLKNISRVINDLCFEMKIWSKNVVNNASKYFRLERISFTPLSVVTLLISKLATIVEGDPKAPFSIATTPRCRGGRYSIPRIAPLYP